MAVYCPICNKVTEHYCKHFVGWTEDGKSIKTRNDKGDTVREDDFLIPTGVTMRVYRRKNE